MAKIELTVKQIVNLGLWDKVCEYKGWSPYVLNEGKIDENESVGFDDEFKKETKWEIEYSDCSNELMRTTEEALNLAKGNQDLENKINTLFNYADRSLKYEIIVRELEEYLEQNEHKPEFNDIQDIVGRGLNLDFPENY